MRPAPRSRRLFVVLAVVVLGACSSDAAPGPTEGPSFACIEAVAKTGLTQGSTAAEARARIEELLDDVGAPLSENERAFWDEHLDRLRGLPADEPVGEALNGIPCDL